ncbi:hypothetical protein ACFU9F_02450 [Streptomyces zhihengii]|uniref:hypothetical protein n=1 Tax=Streptomyces zhihengii TaxID=1818004 RepID=UPI0036B82833
MRAVREKQLRRVQPEFAARLLDIRDGWWHFWHHDLLRRVAFISAVVNFFGVVTGILLVLLITGPYRLAMSGYGLFTAGPAAGSLPSSRPPVTPFLAWGAARPSPWWPCSLAALATSPNQIVVSALRQAAVPDQLPGRATAAYRLIVLGAVPLGALSGGLLGRVLGIRATFVAAVTGLTLTAVPLASRVSPPGACATRNAHLATSPPRTLRTSPP